MMKLKRVNEFLNKFSERHIDYEKYHIHVHSYASRQLWELVLFINFNFFSMILRLFSNFFLLSPLFCLTVTYLAINIWEFCVSFSAWNIQESAYSSNVLPVFCKASIFDFKFDIWESTTFTCTSLSTISRAAS